MLAPANGAAAKGITASQLNTVNNGVIPSSFFRGNNNEAPTTIPKAYLNYIFFDEQFKYAGGGTSRVGTSGLVKDHWYADAQLQNIAAPFDARLNLGVIGGMISNSTLYLSPQQLQNIFNAANTVSKYDNSGALKDMIRNLGPIIGALKRQLQK